MSAQNTFQDHIMKAPNPLHNNMIPPHIKKDSHTARGFEFAIDGDEVKLHEGEEPANAKVNETLGTAYCTKNWRALCGGPNNAGCRRAFDPSGKTPGTCNAANQKNGCFYPLDFECKCHPDRFKDIRAANFRCTCDGKAFDAAVKEAKDAIAAAKKSSGNPSIKRKGKQQVGLHLPALSPLPPCPSLSRPCNQSPSPNTRRRSHRS